MKDKLPPRFTVAFNRDRDSYMVPWGLAECGLLENLITDIYLPDAMAQTWLAALLNISNRHCAAISSARVKWNLKALYFQLWSLRRCRSAAERSKIFQKIDISISCQAARESRRTDSHLFLYSGYAREAFIYGSAARKKKLLFVYHPQGDYVRKILESDVILHPEVEVSHMDHLREIELVEGDRFKEEILMADSIVCASSFTRVSIEHILPNQIRPIVVVPYGCDWSNSQIVGNKENSRPRFLFVGQGTQRKGLHHLLKVWKKCGFSAYADLTLVINSVDRGIVKLIENLPHTVRILSGLTREDLIDEYRSADFFVMPSLVEGFGLVYLEAMAEGCFVIGTSNTGLPDLNLPGDVGLVLPAGDLEALEGAINYAIKLHQRREVSVARIRAIAATHSWTVFRQKILQFAMDGVK